MKIENKQKTIKKRVILCWDIEMSLKLILKANRTKDENISRVKIKER